MLILGTMPGAESLARQQYYANSRNAFWRIVEPWSGAPSTSYDARCARITAAGIALWDVLRECERDGSSDSSIGSPVVNDIGALLIEHPTLAHILFNGQTARTLFDSLLAVNSVELATMPSTSPANARPGKFEVWRDVLRHVLR